jgi:hypothetical protein
MIVMRKLRNPTSELLYSPRPHLTVSVDLSMLAVRKVSHITVAVMERFYFFPMGVVAQTSSVQKRLKTTSETM